MKSNSRRKRLSRNATILSTDWLWKEVKMKASKAGVLKVGDWRIDSINKKSRGVGGKSYIEQKDQSELFSNVL